MGEAPLDPSPALEQPVEHVEQLIAADRTQLEQGGEAAGGGFGREAPRGGELRGRRDHTGNDGRERQAAHAAGGTVQDAFEPDPACRAEYGGDVAMVEGAFDPQQLGEIADGDATLEDGAKALDDMRRELGQIGDGLLTDPLACAVERRAFLVGANPTRQLSLLPVAARAVCGGNDMS